MISNETQSEKRSDLRLEPNDEMFRLFVDSIQDYAIFLLDVEGNVATWNQGAAKIKGYAASEIIGQHFSKFYPKEAQETRWPQRELEIAAREGRFSDEGLRVRKDGSTFWAHVVISALRHESGALRGFSKVTRDLTERRTLEEKTRRLNRELRSRVSELLETQRQVELRTLELQKLSGELLRVQDDERRRMARTLHDDLGQELTALKLELDIKDEKGTQKGQLLPARELTASALGKVRNLSYLLHPPLLDESGLLPALHWYFEGLQTRGQIRITFDYKPVSFPRLPRDIEITVFRIMQESLTNVYRHSESKDARIELVQDSDVVTVRIRDFGKGIAESRIGLAAVAGVGINGMKERVKQFTGELKISRVEPGTLVVATIPIIETA